MTLMPVSSISVLGSSSEMGDRLRPVDGAPLLDLDRPAAVEGRRPG